MGRERKVYKEYVSAIRNREEDPVSKRTEVTKLTAMEIAKTENSPLE